MKRNQSSLTAAGIAVMCAVESEKPAGERICFDPYARRFAGTGLYYAIRRLMHIGRSAG
jgi:O-methyltransferase involved in polyketide biosynthesis